MNNTELLNQLLSLTVWKQIDGYENYEVSICGQVRNVTTKRILRPRIGNGYYIVNLYKNTIPKTLKIHRLVALHFIPKLDDKTSYIDHIDNNRLNNTISNLRWCNVSQNGFNRQLNKNSTTGIKGICLHKQSNKWQARIRLNNKQIHIGLFDNLDDAKLARQLKAAELFGEF